MQFVHYSKALLEISVEISADEIVSLSPAVKRNVLSLLRSIYCDGMSSSASLPGGGAHARLLEQMAISQFLDSRQVSKVRHVHVLAAKLNY